MYMFSSVTGPAPNPGRAIALHLLRNCVSHMSGRMPAEFCVYPTVRIKFERKCICLYIQNVLRAAAVKICIPYHTHLFIKKVYTLLYIQNRPALPIFPAAGSNVYTHVYAFYLKKVHTLPYIPICRQQSEKEDKTQFCGQAKACKATAWFAGRPMAATTLRGAGFLLFHYTHRAHNLPAIHPAAAPRPRLPATLPRCRAHKNQKKDTKILTILDV